ncbi:MAG: UxaA family hydrolase [Flavobacteriaceae bacterium]
MKNFLIVSEGDNVAVALQDLKRHDILAINGSNVSLAQDIPSKHKVALTDLAVNDIVNMYGVPVGRVVKPISKGGIITTDNVMHTAAPYGIKGVDYIYDAPEVGALRHRSFMGFHRPDGQVGTANYWAFIPLVFCQNRNLKVLREAFEAELGFKKENPYRWRIRQHAGGKEIPSEEPVPDRPFNNIDGIKFLTHVGGCGSTREDAQSLVDLLAGYIKNPNVAGATVLSLGCQHAQIDLLKKALADGMGVGKPVHYFEQQQYGTEREMMFDIIDTTFQSLTEVNKLVREPAPLSKLSIGLECGGSDGFSGITANPLIGHVSDRINTLGGRTILAEFPELCGVEQDLINRCTSREIAQKFIGLMEDYGNLAKSVGSGFDMNPSPGNIKDGLITDAMKSAGAATKGGRSPIADVLDYGEYATKQGLHLLCTPGNDVESTTGLAGFGANLILFSTGLGTPTGNIVCPVIKISTNSELPKRMKDIIDFDAGRLLSGHYSMEQMSDELIELIIAVASGEKKTCADVLGQDDFIPWKRGVSL